MNDFQEAFLAYIFTPLQIAAYLPYAASATSAKIKTHHVEYATAQVLTETAVSFVKHVPTISQVPITIIEDQLDLLQKQVHVVKPAIITWKIEVGIF